MGKENRRNIISVKSLSQIIGSDNLVILDTSFDRTASGVESEYKGFSIPTSRYFDLKGKFSDQNSEYPNMLLTSDQFSKQCQILGISNDSRIVVYDRFGIYSSARVWWMFKLMGHENVSVLDGGLPEWILDGNVIDEGYSENYHKGDFSGAMNSSWVKSFFDIHKNMSNNKALVVDARSNDRFTGEKQEPRQGSRSGHIPNSINIHYKKLFNVHLFKSEIELKLIFKTVVDDKRPLILSCGSGVTACILYLVLEEYFRKEKYIYDGSWSEYGRRDLK